MKYVPAKHTYKIYKIDNDKTYIQDRWIMLQDIHTRQSILNLKYVPAKHTYKIYKIDFGKTY